jgi:hypothetical protein
MVISFHQTGRLAVAFSAALLLCQCETQRTVKSTRSSISFDEGMWGGQGGGSDQGKIRSKFAEKGYTIAEDGSIKADRPNLYADSKARGTDGKFSKKQARFRKTEARTKEFRTPEYVKRQQFRGAEEARESGSSAREGNFESSRDRASGQLFGKKTESSSDLASFNAGSTRDAGRTFTTEGDREASEAVRAAPVADGRKQMMGYQDNASLSMDDVKKMVSPGDYARRKRLN